jgi:hypothetical protein
MGPRWRMPDGIYDSRSMATVSKADLRGDEGSEGPRRYTMTIVWPRRDVRDFVGTSKSYEGPYEGRDASRGHLKVASVGI